MTGIERIAKERKRQIEEEGYTAEHDDQHEDCELAAAASCYAMHAGRLGIWRRPRCPMDWPWNERWWKPYPQKIGGLIKRDDAIHILGKAGALIAAEIDRIERKESL